MSGPRTVLDVPDSFRGRPQAERAIHRALFMPRSVCALSRFEIVSNLCPASLLECSYLAADMVFERVRVGVHGLLEQPVEQQAAGFEVRRLNRKVNSSR